MASLTSWGLRVADCRISPKRNQPDPASAMHIIHIVTDVVQRRQRPHTAFPQLIVITFFLVVFYREKL